MGEIPEIDYNDDQSNAGLDPERQQGEGIPKLIAGVAGGVLLCIAFEGQDDPFIKDAIEFIVGFGVAKFVTNKLIKRIKKNL